jgi:hypothetical protein
MLYPTELRALLKGGEWPSPVLPPLQDEFGATHPLRQVDSASLDGSMFRRGSAQDRIKPREDVIRGGVPVMAGETTGWRRGRGLFL